MEETAVGRYLRDRRGLLQPGDVGLPLDPNRRVAGLRREEVAMLAGISPDYYLRLEQGRDAHPSDQVLNAISRALLLDAEAEAYLHRLVRMPPRAPARSLEDDLDELVVDSLNIWSHTAAYVANSCRDVLLANDLAAELNDGIFRPGSNLIYAMFNPEFRPWVRDWEGLADTALAGLRASASPDDPRLHEIVGDLTMKYPDFSRIWARHEVRAASSGTANVLVGGVGVIEFTWMNLSVPNHPGLILTTYFGDPGSEAERALATVAARQAERKVATDS